MDILGGVNKVLDATQPIRKAAADVNKAVTQAPVADPTGAKAAKAAGQGALQQAVARGNAARDAAIKAGKMFNVTK